MNPRKVILLVEDNIQDEILTVKALRRHGVRTEIVVCRDGADAVDWLFHRGVHAERDVSLAPAVVLLDLKLPKLNGHEVLAEVRSNPETKLIPIVVLTTSMEESDVARSYNEGANSFVQKPVNFDDFSEAVRNLGTYWLSVNEPPKTKFQTSRDIS